MNNSLFYDYIFSERIKVSNCFLLRKSLKIRPNARAHAPSLSAPLRGFAEAVENTTRQNDEKKVALKRRQGGAAQPRAAVASSPSYAAKFPYAANAPNALILEVRENTQGLRKHKNVSRTL